MTPNIENVQNGKKLKIMQIAPFVLPIGKTKYGGIEQVIKNLDSEFSKKGHNSYVFCSKDSSVNGIICPSAKESLWIKSENYINDQRDLSLNANNYQIEFEKYCGECVEFIKKIKPDIVHDHIGFVKSQSFKKENNLPPILSTLHTSSNYEHMMPYKEVKKEENGKKIFFNTVSKSQKNIFEKIIEVDYVIYNAIDVEEFPFQEEHKGYAFYLGSIYQEKGVETAINTALALEKKFIFGGPVHYFNPKIKAFWENSIKDKIDFQDFSSKNPLESIQNFLNSDKKIMFVGELGESEKKEFYKYAEVFYFPIQLEEAFGLVIAEANACGTPVIANNRGAIPEIIENGKNGFIVQPTNIINFIDFAKKVKEIDRKNCRKHIEENFSINKQIGGYLSAYKDIISR
jgi:glycosyltransferase involved in cell wall biosynthesis